MEFKWRLETEKSRQSMRLQTKSVSNYYDRFSCHMTEGHVLAKRTFLWRNLLLLHTELCFCFSVDKINVFFSLSPLTSQEIYYQNNSPQFAWARLRWKSRLDGLSFIGFPHIKHFILPRYVYAPLGDQGVTILARQCVRPFVCSPSIRPSVHLSFWLRQELKESQSPSVRSFVRSFVCSVQVCLELSIFIILAHFFKQSVSSQWTVSKLSESTQIALR